MIKKYSLGALVLIASFVLTGCAVTEPPPETKVSVCSKMSEYSKTDYTNMNKTYAVQLKNWAKNAEPELQDALLILSKAVKADPGAGRYDEAASVKSICGSVGINDLNGY